MARQRVGLALLDRGVFAQQARERLAQVLGDDGELGEPDEEAGIFEATVEAETFEAALDRVFDAIAEAGADDHIVFVEHPSLPGHFKRRPAP